MRRKRMILVLFIGLFTGLFVWRMFFVKTIARPPVSGRKGIEKITVKVDLVKRTDLGFILSYIGSLKAKDEINVLSKVSGKLSDYLVSVGDKVEKGQTIALVDRDETGLKYELAKVESPISGTVGMTLLDKGADVIGGSNTGAKATTLAVIVNMEEMTVRLAVSEMDIPYIKKGLKASLKVDSYPNEDFTGEISKVSEVVDTSTRTLPVEISIPNLEHRLKSGMFVRVSIFAGVHQDALVIGQDALVQEDSSNYVYAVEDSIAKKVKVEAGIRQGSKIEILKGLEEGQKIIVFGHQGLKDGTEVNVVE